jgi:hypothetical protein
MLEMTTMVTGISIIYLGLYLLLGFTFPLSKLLAFICFGWLAVQVLKNVKGKEDKNKQIIKELTGIEYLK